MTNVNKTPHIHAALIKQWADGATIEVAIPKDHTSDCYHRFDAWMEVKNPEWNPKKTYRVKPEPKPDVVKYAQIVKRDNHVEAAGNLFTTEPWGKDNLMVVFDGETGELKDVQLLAKE